MSIFLVASPTTKLCLPKTTTYLYRRTGCLGSPVSLTDMTSDSAPGPCLFLALPGTIPGMLIALGGTARRRRHGVQPQA